ncbi:MAG TPA: hypothetical protein VLG27_04465 [Candidatus Saccharimonadia bacterium]|nr:hypothetical protein [Candidatus Saccharimonadia bacterium]
MARLVAGPDTDKGADTAQQDAPRPEPVAMVHGSAYPSAKCAKDSDTKENH